MKQPFGLVLGFVAACTLQAACSVGGESPSASSKPATVEQIQGKDVSRVTLTARAAARLGIEIEPVREESSSATQAGRRTANTVIPEAALVYDPTGGIWVYIAIADPSGLLLIYERHPVRVVLIQDGLAVLSSGPGPGTPVVVVGAAELLGTEYAVEGG